MKVLVTGGTGVIGEGLVPALLDAGHAVRLLSRGAAEDSKRWPDEVEPFAADVTDPKSLRGAAEGCDAVVHVTGIVEESPPRVTFERVNVGGTKNVLAEATRAGARRVLFLSSLGADRGKSDYHRSKLRAERVVGASKLDWLILRPGNVYGPGDEVISTLLKLIRALPVVPVIGGGGQRFQPIWYEDLGRAVVRALDAAFRRETLELAGREVTTTNDLVERLSAITGRGVTRLSVPSWLAALGVQVAGAANLEKLLGVRVPLNDAKLKMLLEGNTIRHASSNALTKRLGVEPTPLDEGLRLLADRIPEQLPSEGVGSLVRKRFWAEVRGSRLTPTELMGAFRERCAEVMPLEFSAEPGTPRAVEEGATLTLALPLRGNVQVRVEEVAARRVTFATVEGHMLAGAIRFEAGGDRRRGVRFSVEVHARPATTFDWVAVNTFGDAMQNSNWVEVVERVVALSGGEAPEGVRSDSATLDEEEAKKVERGLRGLVNRRKRAESAPAKRAARRGPSRKTPEAGAVGGAVRLPAVVRAPRASSGAAADAVSKAVGAASSLAATALKAAANAAAKRPRKSRKSRR